MTTDTLHDYDRLVDTGFSDDQARAVVELLATSTETDPDVTRALQNIERLLDEHGQLLGGLREDVNQLHSDLHQLRSDFHQLRSDLHIIDERMQSESRIQRMLNTTLIAIGALLGSLLAVFAR